MSHRRVSIHGVILTFMTLACTGLMAWVLVTGLDYYGTALGDRVHHAAYRLYRPAGWVGHGLGLLGTGMILLLLLYSVRKRAGYLQGRGQLPIWLNYHIWLGVCGPLLIVLHTSFKIGGLVSLSFWSMTAVALSGVFGRYLYQQIPRNVLGEALGSEAIERQNEEILVLLAGRHRLGQEALAHLEDLAVGPLTGKPPLWALMVLPWLNSVLARQLQTWRARSGPDLPGEALAEAQRWVLQTRRLRLFNQVRDWFHWWHVFHKPFAVIMIIVMLIHVAVALALGQTWSWSGYGS